MKIIISTIIFLVSIVAQAQLADQFYPFKSAGMASVSSAVFSDSLNEGYVFYDYNFSRYNVFTAEKQSFLSSVYIDGTKDTLVIVIPGIGGTSDSGNTSTVAKIFKSWNFPVLTFNNPFSFKFALTLSKNGNPGYFPQDSRELYQHILYQKGQVENLYRKKFQKVWLVSFSLGTQYSAEILKISDERKDFEIEKVVMMHPPVDLVYSIDKYDDLHLKSEEIVGRWRQTTYKRIDLAMNKIFELTEKLQSAPRNRVLESFMKNYNLTELEADVVIARVFRYSLWNTLYVTALVHEDAEHLFSSPMTYYRRELRHQEIKKVTLKDYYERMIFPYIGLGETSPNEVLNSLSFKRNPTQLIQDHRIVMVLSRNDPISKDTDVDEISALLGERALVYQNGGHCGLYWYPLFQEELKKFLSVKSP